MKRFDHKSVKFRSYFTWENFVKEKRDYYSQGRHQPQYFVIIRGIANFRFTIWRQRSSPKIAAFQKELQASNLISRFL